MHVGHLRTTIIGDSLARVLGHLGATVIRQNHLGDWGTQFGMLIQYLDEHPDAQWRHSDLAAGEVEPGASTVSALDGLYRVARAEFDADEAFADRSRARVVALQAGDEATVQRWREIVDESELAFREIYGRLGVLLEPGDSAGESFYNQWLAEVVDELLAAGVATHSDGAVVVESEDVKAPDGQPAVLMVQKRDGGYGYDTTDLATLRYRVRDLKADRILYVVDARQALHFRLIFEAARRMGWLAGKGHEGVEAVHVAFGTVLGPDGRPFKTRAGGTVRLMHLIDEAVDSARRTVAEREPDLPPAELDRIAEQAGVGAVKYADLSTSRVKDYTFDIARMVSLTGNTSVYLQYAHARIRSILRKAGPSATTGDRPGAAAAPGRAGAGAGARRVRRRAARRRRDERAAPAVQLPVRDGEGVHRLLRELPGALGARRRAGEPAGAVPAGGGDPARRARPAGDRRAGPDVVNATRTPPAWPARRASRRWTPADRRAARPSPAAARPGP